MRNRSNLGAKLISAPYVVWDILFIVAPLIFVVYYSFTTKSGDFTFDNITALSRFIPTFIRSIWFGIEATIICLVIAFPTAYIISQRTDRIQRTMVLLVMLPMWTSFLIRTYSWMLILDNNGIINSVLTSLNQAPVRLLGSNAVVLGMVYNFLPYMILPIYSVMAKLDYSMVEAAQDLGGNRATVIKRCIIPMSMPGVVSGITMVFVPSVSTFYISQKLGGGIDLIGDVIERQFQLTQNYNLGASISLVLMVLILVSMAVMNKFSDEGEMVL